MLLLWTGAFAQQDSLRRDVRALIRPPSRVCSLYCLGKARFNWGAGEGEWRGFLRAEALRDSFVLVQRRGVLLRKRLPVEFSPGNPYNFLEVDGQKYRGKIRLIPYPNGQMAVVNRLPIEDYLKGVLPFEIGHHDRDKLEALKAQAVAARTYTMGRILAADEGKAFDVFSDVSDQVYKGLSGEYPMSDRAIRETKGVVAMYQDSLADCYYHSTCGGRTSTLAAVWPQRTARPYLISVFDQRDGKIHCHKSKRSTWHQEWTALQLTNLIRRYLPLEDTAIGDCGKFKDMRIRKRGPSGRILELEIRTTTGKYTVYGDRVRWVLRRPEPGNPILYSAWFELQKEPRIGKPRKYVAIGRGWGHGVGMCQVGALGMAERGSSYTQILGHYYRGISLKKIY